ncbi:hypothetical protein IWX50DRAFT_401999 [Phyllosticta citricarpa]
MRQPAPHPPSANVLLPGPALLHSAICFSTTTWMLACWLTSRTAELLTTIVRAESHRGSDSNTYRHTFESISLRNACMCMANVCPVAKQFVHPSIHPSIHPPGGITHFASAKLPMSPTVATRTHRFSVSLMPSSHQPHHDQDSIKTRLPALS